MTFPEHGVCRFDGAATFVHLQGVGPSMLVQSTDHSPLLSHARVRLDGATLEQISGSPTIDHATRWIAVYMNDDKQRYDVTYTGGTPLKIHIADGGNSGVYSGPLCAHKHCPIAWNQVKDLVIWRDNGDLASVTERFPMGDTPTDTLKPATGETPSPQQRRAIRLESVELGVAYGEVRCGAEVRQLRDGWRWADEELDRLSLGAIDVQDGLFRIHLESPSMPTPAHLASAPPPEPTGPPAWGGFGAALPVTIAVTLLVLALFAVVLHRWRRATIAAGIAGLAVSPAVSSELLVPPPDPRSAPPVKIFLNHDDADKDLVAKLVAHLAPLVKDGHIEIWSPTMCTTGNEIAKEIDTRLGEADILLTFLSADFISSNEYEITERPSIRERHREGDLLIVPIRLRPFDAGHLWLTSLHALPVDRPITGWPAESRDPVWAQVALEIRRIVVERRRRFAKDLASSVAG
jgi:hypothetical protein